MSRAVLFIVLASMCESANVAAVPKANQPEFLPQDQRTIATDFAEKDIYDKESVSLENLRGKVVLLNFWATWCPPCRTEIPALVALQNSYSRGLEVIGVSVFSYTTTTEQFYRDYHINYTMIYGSYELMGSYGKMGSIPTSFLIDKKGRIAARIVGSRTKDEYEHMIKTLIAE